VTGHAAEGMSGVVLDIPDAGRPGPFEVAGARVNPGGNTVLGQNQVTAGPATSTKSIPGSEVKNGNLSFTSNPATLTAPATVSGTVAGCPNGNWTGTLHNLQVTSVTLTIEQPPGTTILTCTASKPSGFSETCAVSC
jgi:hypothetical protein